MTEFIRDRAVRREVSYRRIFAFRQGEGAGFSFPCDAEGHVLRETLSERSRANYDACVSGELDVADLGVRVEEHRWVEPAAIRCLCRGEMVELAGFTNTCTRCGRDYDSNGSLLAPREQWGEETGESPSEILRIR